MKEKYKQGTAIIILFVGYTIIGLVTSGLVYIFHKPLGLIIGAIIVVFLAWIIIIWAIEEFIWAHNNWRKQ